MILKIPSTLQGGQTFYRMTQSEFDNLPDDADVYTIGKTLHRCGVPMSVRETEVTDNFCIKSTLYTVQIVA